MSRLSGTVLAGFCSTLPVPRRRRRAALGLGCAGVLQLLMLWSFPAWPAESLWSALVGLSGRHQVVIVSEVQAALQRVSVTAAGSPADDLDGELDRLLEGTEFSWKRSTDGRAIEVFRLAHAELALDPLRIDAGAAPQAVAQAFDPAKANALGTATGSDRFVLDELVLPGARRLDSVYRRAPNVVPATTGYAIRGIERGAAASAAAQLYFDGVPLPTSVAGDMLLPGSIAAIDFQRGPRSALDPLGGLAGAIRVEGRGWSNAGRSVGVAGGGQLQRVGAETDFEPWAGSLARVDIDMASEQADLRYADGTRAPRTEQAVALVKLAWSPAWSDSLDIDAVALAGAGGLPERRLQPGPDGVVRPGARTSYAPAALERDLDVQGGALSARWIPPFGGSVHAGFAASRGDLRRARVLPGAFQELGTALARERLAEQVLAWTSDPWRGLAATVALAHADRDGELADGLRSPLQAFFPIEGGVEVVPATQRVLMARSLDRLRSDALSIGIAGQSEHWAWSGVLRRIRETRSLDLFSGLILDNPQCALVFPTFSVPCEQEFPSVERRRSLHSREWNTAPQWRLSWLADARNSVSLDVRRGLIPGGARLNPQNGGVLPYRSERSFAYGLDWSHAGERLHWRAGLFYNDWRDRQVRVELPGEESFFISNAGEASAWGGEVVGGWSPSAPAWRSLGLQFGVGWMRSRFDRYTLPAQGATVDLSGNAFPSAPRLNGRIGLRWDAQGWSLAAHLWAAASAFSDAFNSSQGRRPGYAVLDLQLRYRLHAELEAWVGLDNAFDRAYVDDIRLTGSPARVLDYRPGTRRQWLLGLEWRFD